jgi:c-di-GMP-binding flagellar brake protein YcgR
VENKRFEYRTPVQIIVDHLKVPAGEQPAQVKGYIRELSASGCRLEAQTRLSEGQDVLLSFVLSGGNTVVNARVRVIRVLTSRHGRQTLACQFVDLPEADQYKLREYVVWLEAHGGEQR